MNAKLYSTKEVAEIWGISYWRVLDLVKAGKLRPLIGLGRGWKWKGDELEAVFERL